MTGDAEQQGKIAIEPFDPAKHDRTAFSCGSEPIDNFLHRTARKHQKGDFIRVWVAVRPDSPNVIGYYSINSHAIQAHDLPGKFTRNAPSHGGIGAAYISTFGVDAKAQGAGIGTLLIADALKRIARLSEEIGIFAVVLDVLDDGDEEAVKKRHKFYRRFGFIDFPSHPLRMFLPVKTIRQGLE